MNSIKADDRIILLLKIRGRHDYCCRIDFDFGDNDDDGDDDNDDYDDVDKLNYSTVDLS